MLATKFIIGFQVLITTLPKPTHFIH